MNFALRAALTSAFLCAVWSCGSQLAAAVAAQSSVPSKSAHNNSPPPSLSAATQQKIAKMRPLFDGNMLAGWIQAPPAPVSFSTNDIVDLTGLTKKISEKSDAVAALIAERYEDTAGTKDAKQATSTLVRNLNRLCAEGAFYDANRFRDVRLRPETEALRARNPQGLELARLNRLLLEDAFPRELARSPAASWIVKDGAMASTGAGRGVIYTTKDFTRYRLVFTMRHVSGNPDHQPCVLIFCTRPAPGERGLDALGGIQFQTPNGGHWDYRPGHNNAGNDYFTRPVRTTFDNHEWHQVEILVDAKTGVARMAVAQPVGTRAIENCVFQDSTAGKTGPLAWQMHNAGLFDEFKDVRIEIDPAEDRLITVE
jgi:hypothetical protein